MAPDHHPSAQPIDLLVIGGGINGTGIARDAAGRNLSVTLVERGDLAGATSSCSSKLVHGGLRYLEQHAPGGRGPRRTRDPAAHGVSSGLSGADPSIPTAAPMTLGW